MAAWVKIAAVLAGLFGLAAVVTIFGLPPQPAKAPEAASAGKPGDTAKPDAKPAEVAKAPETGKAAESPKPADAAKSVEPAKPADAAAAPSADATRLAKADPSSPTTAPVTPPTFDVVRVLPTGEVVVAGRAAPNASVQLLRNGAVHHTVTADAAGQFAMVPPNLGPGSHDLTLVITLPDGRRETSRQSVAVSVPAGGVGNVVVALASPDKPTEILSQLPSAAASPTAKAPVLAPGERQGVVLGSVEVEESGRFFATGRSAPGAIVRLYLNDTFLAAATASPEGKWSFAINRGVEPGSYRVRIDEVDANGTVITRAEVPFEFGARVAGAGGPGSRPAGLATGPALMPAKGPNPPAGPQVASTEPTVPGGANVVVDEIRTTTVSRGDSLWRISKRIYGRGLRYTVIYEANQKQIRDPRLIYPGQLFVLPGEQPN